MHVFYQPNLTQTHIKLSEDESKHCIRVLRMQKGDVVFLADGNGTKAKAIVDDDHPKRCVLQVIEKVHFTQQQSSGRNYKLHIMVAPTKNFDRMEWFIEKAVEAGIDEITFIESENSERAKVNIERCEKIAVSAMKQSKQWYLPTIHSLVDFEQAVSAKMEAEKLMAWCETEQTQQLAQVHQKKSTQVILLIGPEGDFTAKEVELAKQQGFIPVSLGTTILRTETAALYGVMAIKALHSF